MKKKPEASEKRRSRRYRQLYPIVATLKPSSAFGGQVCDISYSGVSVTYRTMDSRLDEPYEIDICFADFADFADCLLIRKIPVRTAWHKILKSGGNDRRMSSAKRGLSFRGLTSPQKTALQRIISSHTSGMSTNKEPL